MRKKGILCMMLALVVAACLVGCAPKPDGLTNLEVVLPDGSVEDMMHKSSVTVPHEDIGKTVVVRGTKVVDGEEITKDIAEYELKEGYNDITVHVTLADGETEERRITVYAELPDSAQNPGRRSDTAEPAPAGEGESEQTAQE